MTKNLESKIRNNYKSKGEKTIAKLLDQYNIKYRYEPDLYLQEGEKSYIWHPDFHLPQYQTIIEYFGIKNDKNYENCIQRKKRIYHQNNYNLIPVYPETLRKDFKTYIMKSIHNYLSNRLTDFKRKTRYIK